MEPDNSGQRRDTTSVWFDEAFCQALIADLKRTDIHGLRVYFGAYEKHDEDPDKRNKLTVVLVTTTGSPTNPEVAVDDHTPPLKAEYNDGRLCPPKCNPPLA